MKFSKLENNIKEALITLKVSGDSLQENLSRLKDKNKNETEMSVSSLSDELNLVFGNITEYDPPADVLRLVPDESARVYCVMPLDLIGDNLKLAVVDPTDMDMLTDIQLISGKNIRPVVSDRKSIEKMISIYYKNSGQKAAVFKLGDQKTQRKSSRPNASRKIVTGLETPIIRLVNDIIAEAVNLGASDIHFEPFEREMKVRLRQDGILRVHRTINSRSMPEVTSRVKIMANLDIAEKRRPQDGRIRVEGGERAIDMRISTLPTDNGEKIVIRILDKGAVALDLEAVGLDRKGLLRLRDMIHKPYGMALVTGPTGSGKTTTLYSALNEIKSPELNISTIEDPIEYKLEGIVQTAVKREIDLTFANALRTLLRQDPNVIMVGEIRDEETAQMAIRAALTGHLVFSTLHTNDAPSAITRLLDMDLEPFLVASSLTMVLAQRLVRKICTECAEDTVTDPKLLSALGIVETSTELKKGRGCGNCNQTGYSGRIGLFELMPISDDIRNMIGERKDAAMIRETAVREGMVTLRQDGINKIKAGLTTPEEVLRETT